MTSELKPAPFYYICAKNFKTMAKIYVASSWRNQFFPEVVKQLREYGHEVYDFRNPHHGHETFMWKKVDPNFESWTVEDYKKGLEHPASLRQFQADLEALEWAMTYQKSIVISTFSDWSLTLTHLLNCSRDVSEIVESDFTLTTRQGETFRLSIVI